MTIFQKVEGFSLVNSKSVGSCPA